MDKERAKLLKAVKAEAPLKEKFKLFTNDKS